MSSKNPTTKESTGTKANAETFAFAPITDAGRVNVANQSYDDVAAHTYTVTVDARGHATESCTCPSDTYHDGPCKHREAVEGRREALATAAPDVRLADGDGLFDDVTRALSRSFFPRRRRRGAHPSLLPAGRYCRRVHRRRRRAPPAPRRALTRRVDRLRRRRLWLALSRPARRSRGDGRRRPRRRGSFPVSAASWTAEAGVKASMFGAGVFVASTAFGPLAPPLAAIIVVAATHRRRARARRSER